MCLHVVQCSAQKASLQSDGRAIFLYRRNTLDVFAKLLPCGSAVIVSCHSSSLHLLSV